MSIYPVIFLLLTGAHEASPCLSDRKIPILSPRYHNMDDRQNIAHNVWRLTTHSGERLILKHIDQNKGKDAFGSCIGNELASQALYRALGIAHYIAPVSLQFINGEWYQVSLDVGERTFETELVVNPLFRPTLKDYSWHTIVALLMRPGDAHCGNYIVTGTAKAPKLISIDHEISFRPAVVQYNPESASDQTSRGLVSGVNSIFFCIDEMIHEPIDASVCDHLLKMDMTNVCHLFKQIVNEQINSIILDNFGKRLTDQQKENLNIITIIEREYHRMFSCLQAIQNKLREAHTQENGITHNELFKEYLPENARYYQRNRALGMPISRLIKHIIREDIQTGLDLPKKTNMGSGPYAKFVDCRDPESLEEIKQENEILRYLGLSYVYKDALKGAFSASLVSNLVSLSLTNISPDIPSLEGTFPNLEYLSISGCEGTLHIDLNAANLASLVYIDNPHCDYPKIKSDVWRIFYFNDKVGCITLLKKTRKQLAYYLEGLRDYQTSNREISEQVTYVLKHIVDEEERRNGHLLGDMSAILEEGRFIEKNPIKAKRFRHIQEQQAVNHLVSTVDDLDQALINPHGYCEDVASDPTNRIDSREEVFLNASNERLAEIISEEDISEETQIQALFEVKELAREIEKLRAALCCLI